MNPTDIDQTLSATGDFNLLEGLYQLTVTGHTGDQEFDSLNKAVYERLLSAYGDARENTATETRGNAFQIA